MSFPLFPDTVMKSIRRLQTGCWPRRSSVLKSPSSAAQAWAGWPTSCLTRRWSSMTKSHTSPPALVSYLWHDAYCLKLMCLKSVHKLIPECVPGSAGPCRAAGVRDAAGPRVCLHARPIPRLRGLRRKHGTPRYILPLVLYRGVRLAVLSLKVSCKQAECTGYNKFRRRTQHAHRENANTLSHLAC